MFWALFRRRRWQRFVLQATNGWNGQVPANFGKVLLACIGQAWMCWKMEVLQVEISWHIFKNRVHREGRRRYRAPSICTMRNHYRRKAIASILAYVSAKLRRKMASKSMQKNVFSMTVCWTPLVPAGWLPGERKFAKIWTPGRLQNRPLRLS